MVRALLGSEPAFSPHATEAVWELAEHRYLYIVEDRKASGGRPSRSSSTTSARDRGDRLARAPARQAGDYSNGVRKAIYRDADANEIGLGGAPADA